MGVRKQFWLTKESLEDPPKKRVAPPEEDTTPVQPSSVNTEASAENTDEPTDQKDETQEEEFEYRPMLEHEVRQAEVDLCNFFHLYNLHVLTVDSTDS